MAAIRPAVAADAEPATACVRAAYAPYVERIGREPAPMAADQAALIARGRVWVADEPGAGVVGVLVLVPRREALLLESVAVLPAFQGRGIGRLLIAFAEEHARRLDLSAVELYTNERMTENLRLYPALGYEETGRATQAGFARVFFQKRIA